MSGKDYAFSPGGDIYEQRGRLTFSWRPNTKLIQGNNIRNIEAFIDDLVTKTRPNERPIGDLFILSHGNDAGYMKLALDGTSKVPSKKIVAKHTHYEDLEKAVAKGTVQIPDVLHKSQTNPPVKINVHIRGCRIGQSPTFVQKLWEAFSNPLSVIPLSVTAPKHFHFNGGPGGRGTRTETELGTAEYLAYSFQLNRPDAPNGKPGGMYQFATKKDAVDAFDNGVNGTKFKFIPNRATPPVARDVPRKVWEDIIPENVIDTGTRDPNIDVNVGMDIGDGRTTLSLPHLFRHELGTGGHTVKNINSDPGNNASREVVAKADIKGLDVFQSTHAFPMYVRYGYDNADDFLDSYTWECKWKKKQIHCSLRRHEYTVMVPVTDPDPPHNLFFNGYPAPNSLLFAHPPPKPLLHTDDRLFLTVP
jgi:hypothetical protein